MRIRVITNKNQPLEIKTEQGIREKKLVLVFERIVQPLLHFFVFEIFFPILDHFEHVKS